MCHAFILETVTTDNKIDFYFWQGLTISQLFVLCTEVTELKEKYINKPTKDQNLD